jgi:hypothetical protein
MTNEERFELLWEHYHRQVDENRAVSRALDELREQVRELKDELKSGAGRPHQCSELVPL